MKYLDEQMNKFRFEELIKKSLSKANKKHEEMLRMRFEELKELINKNEHYINKYNIKNANDLYYFIFRDDDWYELNDEVNDVMKDLLTNNILSKNIIWEYKDVFEYIFKNNVMFTINITNNYYNDVMELNVKNIRFCKIKYLVTYKKIYK